MSECGCSAINHTNHPLDICSDPVLQEYDGFCRACKMANDEDDSIDNYHRERKKIRKALS